MESPMKFSTFQHNGSRRVVLLMPDGTAIRPVAADDMIDLITRFESLEPQLY
jgi:hypothetical protein